MRSIAIASDHAGFDYKAVLKRHLESQGMKVQDFGTDSDAPVDYPSYIRAAAQAVAAGRDLLGIFVGGSGNEAIVANRLRGIRCAVVWNEQTARLAKEHGDCNMIAIGQRQVSKEEAVAIVDAWLPCTSNVWRQVHGETKVIGMCQVSDEDRKTMEHGFDLIRGSLSGPTNR